MQNDTQPQDAVPEHPSTDPSADPERAAPTDVDGLKDKTPEELTPEELRLMADTMPGDGPGD